MPHYIIETADAVAPWTNNTSALRQGEYALVIVQAPTGRDALLLVEEEIPDLLKACTQATAVSAWLSSREYYSTVGSFLRRRLDPTQRMPTSSVYDRLTTRPVPTLRELKAEREGMKQTRIYAGVSGAWAPRV